MEKKVNQKLLVVLCWLMYSISYLCRYSYNSNITLIIEKFNVSRADAGLVTTCFFFAYGVGQIVNGIFCKYYNKRFVLSGALILASLLNLSIFLGIPFWLFKYLWLANGFIQSALWPSILLVFAKNLSSENLNSAVVVMASAKSVGTLVTYALSSLLALTGEYKYLFLVGSIFTSIVAVIWLISYSKCVSDSIEQKTATQEKIEKSKVPTLIIFSICILAIFAVSNNMIKDGLSTWVPSILKENFNLGDSLSIFLTLFLPFVSIFGSALAVFVHKYVKNFISVAGLLYFLCIPFIILVITLINTNLYVIVIACLALISLLLTGANTVGTMMFPLFARDYINSGKISGIMNGFCYLGSTISSYGLGKIVDITGNWMIIFKLFFCLIVGITILSIILSILIHKKSINDKKYSK